MSKPPSLKNKLKVEVLHPYIEGQNIGDIRYVKKEDAYELEGKGVLKILEDKDKNNSSETKQQGNNQKPNGYKITSLKEKYGISRSLECDHKIKELEDQKAELGYKTTEDRKTRNDLKLQIKEVKELKKQLNKEQQEKEKEGRKKQEQREKQVQKNEQEKKRNSYEYNLLERNNLYVYRLQQENKEHEALIYDYETKGMYYFSMYRAYSVLINKLRDKGIDVNEEMESAGMDMLNDKPEDFMKKCVEEELYLVENIIFRPRNERIIEENGLKYFNIYHKPDIIELSENTDLKPDIPKPISKLLFHLTGGEEESYEFVLKFLAWKLQRPEEKIPINIVFQGTQGTGKGTFNANVLSKIWENSTTTVNLATLNKTSDNTFLLGTQFLVCEEIFNHENKTEMPQILKNFVDEFVTINQMHKKPLRNVKNYTNMFLFSNHIQPIHLESWDRRYAIFRQLKPISKEIPKEVNSLSDNDLAQFVKYLNSLDVTREEIEAIPKTEAREDLINTSRDTVELFLEDVKTMRDVEHLIESSQDFSLVKDNGSGKNRKPTIKELIGDLEGTNYQNFMKSKDIYELFRVWTKIKGYGKIMAENKFMPTLISKGFEKKRIRIDGLRTTCINFLDHLEDVPDMHREDEDPLEAELEEVEE